MSKEAFRRRVKLPFVYIMGILIVSAFGLFTTGCSELLEEQVLPEDSQLSISDFDTTGCALLSDTLFTVLESPNLDSIDIAWTSGGADTLAELLDTMALDSRLVIRNLGSGTDGYALISSEDLGGEDVVLFLDDYLAVTIISADGDTLSPEEFIPLETLAECPTITLRLAFNTGSSDCLVKIDRTEAAAPAYFTGNIADIDKVSHFVLRQE